MSPTWFQRAPSWRTVATRAAERRSSRPDASVGARSETAGAGSVPSLRRAEAQSAASSVPLAPIKILIVDDEPKNLVVLETILDDPGYELVRAESADQALLALVSEEFALLILDINMPDMTGFELAKTIKERKKTSGIPIIFLTAYYNEDQHVLEGYDTGAVDYLHKPVNAPILRSKVAVFVELYRKQRDAAAANAALVAEVAERRRAEERLRALSETLDQRVNERTAALREKEHFLERVTAIVPGALHVLDLEDGSLVFVSRAGEAMLGYGAEEIRAMGRAAVATLIHPDDVERFEEHLRRVRELRDGEPADFEHRLRRKSGDYVWVQTRDVVFARDAAGNARQIIGAAFDVTERKRAEEALRASEESIRESEERFRTLAERMPHCVWVSDASGAIEYQNGSWYGYAGLSPESDAGASWLDCCHADDRLRLREGWEAALRGERGDAYDVEGRIRRADGEYRWFRVKGSPIRDARGVTIRWAGTCSDIHEQRMLLNALVEAGRRKDEFLATLAHELRNPLAPVRNAVELLNRQELSTPELRCATGVIDRQTRHLSRLIDDLMDVNRISHDRIELKREPVELSRALQAAIETSRPLIEESGHELSVALPPDSQLVDGDLTRLAQVFLNLLNNAAKYTERAGRIDLRAAREGSDVVVSVSDTGVGIPADKLPEIFGMFSQLDGALVRSQGGLGIGLYLAKRLVELHGGTIEARSAGLGKGSEFVVRLPLVLQARARRTGEQPAARNVSGLRILVADDNRDTAAMLTALMSTMGNQVRTVHDGEQVVLTAREFRPHVVLCDIGMPKMNGYEACRRIRDEAWGKDMFLVAVTGWGLETDKRQAQEAGFDRHLVKPVEPSLLLQVLDEAKLDAAR